MPTKKQSTSVIVEPAKFYFFSSDGYEEDAEGEPCSNSQWLGAGSGATMAEAFQDFLKDNAITGYAFTHVWGIQVAGVPEYGFIIPHQDTLDSLIELAENAGYQEGDLDDIVHELKGNEAAEIDNSGLAVQVKYLYDALGPVEARKWLEEHA